MPVAMGKAMRWLKGLLSGIGVGEKKKKKKDEKNTRTFRYREAVQAAEHRRVLKRETIVSEIAPPSTVTLVGNVSRWTSSRSGASLRRRRENYAAITIQSIFRGYLVTYSS